MLRGTGDNPFVESQRGAKLRATPARIASATGCRRPTIETRTIGSYAALAALGPLVPIPFADDWLLSLVRRRAIREALVEHGITADVERVAILAGLEREREARRSWRRMLSAPAGKLSRYLMRRTMRRVVYAFAIHRAAGVASSVFVELWLLRLALERDLVSDESAARVRAALDVALEPVRTTPLSRAARRVLEGSRALIVRVARSLLPWLTQRRADDTTPILMAELERDEGEVERHAARALGGLVDELVRALLMERDQLDESERRFLTALVSPVTSERVG